jgi:hypothetical protein
MTIPELLSWQWQGYPRYHQSRTNLLLHIVTVPLFMAATVTLVAALLLLSWKLLVAAVVGIVVTLVVEGRGHKLEPVPSEPFTGSANFVGRFFFEHWITFPRFVVSGGWWRNLTRTHGDRTG